MWGWKRRIKYIVIANFVEKLTSRAGGRRWRREATESAPFAAFGRICLPLTSALLGVHW